MWEHYSSIRNRGGPHTGPPVVCPCPVSYIASEDVKETLTKSSVVLPWMEDVVAASLPHHETPAKIRETLEMCNGDVNVAVSQLLEEWDTASISESETLANEEDEHQTNDIKVYQLVKMSIETELLDVRKLQIGQQEPEPGEQQLAPEEQQLKSEQQQSQVQQQRLESETLLGRLQLELEQPPDLLPEPEKHMGLEHCKPDQLPDRLWPESEQQQLQMRQQSKPDLKQQEFKPIQPQEGQQPELEPLPQQLLPKPEQQKSQLSKSKLPEQPELPRPEPEQQQSEVRLYSHQQQQQPLVGQHHRGEHPPQAEQQPQVEQQQPELERQEPDPMQGIILNLVSKVTPLRELEPSTVIAKVIEVKEEDRSRVKRRKSPDSSPVNSSTISDDSSSVASSFISSIQSSSSSESDISIIAGRRRKPVYPQPLQPTRRSQRIKAKAAAVVEAPPLPLLPPPVSKGPPKSRRQQRLARRKPSATGGRKRRDVGMQTVTVGIRELYV
jgi:hypothetical protein